MNTWPRGLRVAAFLVLLGATFTFGYAYRNPEDRPLDQVARAAAEGRYARLSDGNTHYRLSGPDSGPPVVLVHGFSTPYYIWDSTAIALSGAGYRVLQYDLFGRGYSDRPDVTYGADLVDRQLGELIDSLGIEGPVHLMGLSYGGFVTATFAGRHPERIRSLTFVDPAAGDSDQQPWFIRWPVIGQVYWQSMVMPGMAGGQLSDFVNPGDWPDWPDRYRVQMQYKGLGRALRSTALFGSGVSLDSVYGTVGKQSFPVQLIWGKEDSVVPIALAPRVTGPIPRTEFHTIERSAHLPHMERTDTVNPILIAFLRRADSTRVSSKQ
jgi:pimeloyl-ACP methyl ester carboxylesterase